MSSPEVERFEVTEEDLINEFYPRPGRRQTKNQATYGIWAEPEVDDERPSFHGSKKMGLSAAPVNFVSGGIKQGDKIKKEGGDDNEDDDIDFTMADISRLSGKKEKQKHASKYGKLAQGQKSDQEFGGWEKHTRGVGMKLLQKMGYEVGKGLGKTSQGITKPVEAVQRKGRGAIAYYGSERTERSLKDYPVVDSDEEEEKEYKNQLQQWKKEPEEKEKKKKPKYVYKTAQEVIDSGGKKSRKTNSELAKVKVIDMTGKEKKVLKGYHAISQRHDKPDEEEEEDEKELIIATQAKAVRAFSMPELMHNLNILVDMAEEDIVMNDRKLRHDSDQIVNMKHEKERLDIICEQEAKQIERLTKVLQIVESCNERSQPGCENKLTLEECAGIFRTLQDEHYEEYKMYDLESLAIALVFPLMLDYFAAWEPLKNTSFGVNTMKEWQFILGTVNQQFGGQDTTNMDVYQRLIWDVWLPFVRRTILTWNVRMCDPLIELLETWMPQLPPWILENILNQLVLPRLLQEVENWNPLIDTMPIHAWLHPWLPLMGDKLEPLYAPIRHKLANALTNWHPSDSSAKVILQPWSRVFKPGHMEAFLVKNILPKLAMCMQEFPINPHQQVLEPWHWVMSWSDLIPVHHMAPMLEKTFFTRWLQVLCSWLGSMPNYEEVTKWYLGWKSLLSEQYLSHPAIKEKFTLALDMMNRAASGHFQPGAKENMAYFTLTEKRQMADTATSVPPSGISAPHYQQPGVRAASTSYPVNFKELVERKAEENSLVFVPLPGKTQEAKQVYKFGSVLIYLDRNVIFMMENQQYVPVSLQRLIDCARLGNS
ncbi:hypothetical protein ACJMK2_028913 [Sinanodonta woodiana]|uniref:G-patch domain-containing protein n=1 Tax=Sinanodonta woodiana TaxID=1069815 RepID=A0ABD3XCK1_SINWO